MRQGEINIITLGCAKNLVDSQALIRKLIAAGYGVRHNPDRITGQAVVVNTCGFILPAQEESIQTILSLIDARNHRRIDKIYVMGCLSQWQGKELQQELPEVDHILGKFQVDPLMEWIKKEIPLPPRNTIKTTPREMPLGVPAHYNYLKIAEGCNQHCSYCAIPLITGPHRSIPMEEVVAMAKQNIAEGASELILVSQDTTFYGMDLYHQRSLPKLVETLAQLPGLKRLRLQYSYPTHFPLELLEVMKRNPVVCPYLDLPLQHSSDKMLRLMRRHITQDETKALIAKIRETIPEIALRTTMIVGHPGEEQEDFEDLLRFVEEMKFERLGVFPYYHEMGTYAFTHYQDNVPQEEKLRRQELLMQTQETAAYAFNESLVGKELEVVVDYLEDGFAVGRTVYDSPEIDPEVLIPLPDEAASSPKVGQYYNVCITGTEEMDLLGRIV